MKMKNNIQVKSGGEYHREYVYTDPTEEELLKIEGDISLRLVKEHAFDYNLTEAIARRDLAEQIHFHINAKLEIL